MKISEIFTAPPTEGLTCEQEQTYAALAQLRIPYQRVEHDWAKDRKSVV